ncbi:MAG: hypothetical protein AB1726_18645 [Planctomycetota bacterium]
MKPTRLLGLFLGLSLLAAANAPDRSIAPEDALPRTDSLRLQSHSAFADWRSAHGDEWRLVRDPESGLGRFLHGGVAGPAAAPRSDAEFAGLARGMVGATAAIHGVDPATLELDRVLFLPLATIGSTDKMTVSFRQSFAGVEVIGGTVDVLLDMAGRLLSIDCQAVPAVSALATSPGIGAEAAARIAGELFAADTGLPATRLVAPALRVERVVEDKFVRPRLVWEIEVHYAAAGMEPEGFRYRIDARTGALSSRVRAVHHDVSGNVKAMATPGAYPDTAGNPEVAQNMVHLTVTSPSGSAQTNANGDFTIAGASPPLNVTVKFDGPYTTTYNQATTTYSLTTTLISGSGNSVLMNPSATEYYTAEANSFLWINALRDWTRSINPSDATCDFDARSNPNIASTCNAYYDGVSVNFYRAGGGCPNTAYSSVVVHEMGHWLNDRYASGNGWDGFGEGNADNFSTYILDDPIVGRDFCGPGCHVRDGNNTRMFCGDANPGCYGEVHADGEVLMGAMWKIRARMKTAYGTSTGGAIANLLFNSWMNAYNDTEIKTIIETHWLTLDDDNGNIGDGTPTYDHIDGGFRDQGFPGYGLTFVAITNVTELGNTTDENGPYTVQADMTALINPPLSAANLYWRVDGGSFVPVPMTLVAGSTYTGDIPGQESPAKVEYYVEGSDSQGYTNTYPDLAPASLLKFIVGIVTQYFFEDFEGGVGGWTHLSYNGAQDDWQHSSQVGSPNGSYGLSGDPPYAYSGTNIWGNDLGATGWNGAYQDNVDNALRSPILDLSAASGAVLRFQRWLTIESGQWDQGNVYVDGVLVWTNPYSTDLLDTSWVGMEIDIAAIADGNPSVQLEWNLDSDSSVVFGGWNVDDVEILSIEAVIDASATPRNGSGVNPSVFTSVTLPILGTSWESRIDGGAVGFSGMTVLFLYSGMSPGISSAYGEILLDPSSSWLTTGYASTGGGGIADHAIAVPSDLAFHGLEVFAQGYLAGGAPGQLTNALDLLLGF